MVILVIKIHILCFLLLCLHSLAIAQIDTTYQLPQIEISSFAQNMEAAGSVVDQIDSLYSSYGGFAQLLSSGSGLYAKTIAPGSSSSPSIRGAASAHTLIVWNGISLSNPMIGQFDLSLFPVDSDDRISVNYGGNSARWGSGAIGGIIDVQSSLNDNQKLNLIADMEMGSFGFRKGSLRFTQKGGKLSSQTRISSILAKNNYTYTLTGGEKNEIINSAYTGISFSEDISYRINDYQKIRIHFLSNNSFRRIPALSTQTFSDAAQNDQNIWMVADWQLTKNNSIYKSRLAFLHDNITYWDHHDSPDPDGQNTKMNQWIWEGEAVSHIFDSHIMETGFSLKHTTAHANTYSDTKTMNMAAMFQSFTLVYPKIKSTLIFREEIDDRNEVLFLPSLGTEWKVLPHFSIKGRISRNFHRPSLNDLYWQPGGNPDLKLEYGWSQDLGVSYTQKIKRFNLGAEVRFFNSDLQNRILWTFQTGDSFWHAENIGDVNSRGVESKISYAHKFNKFTYRVSFGGNLISSTALQDLDIPKIKAGEQLIYVPKEKVYGSLSLIYQRFLISYRFLYNGSVNGVNEEIPSYKTADVLVQYHLPIKHFGIKAYLNVDNIWDESYRIIERRPMPGRNLSIGISFSYAKTQ